MERTLSRKKRRLGEKLPGRGRVDEGWKLETLKSTKRLVLNRTLKGGSQRGQNGGPEKLNSNCNYREEIKKRHPTPLSKKKGTAVAALGERDWESGCNREKELKGCFLFSKSWQRREQGSGSGAYSKKCA